MVYEVFIPAADQYGFDITMKVDAENWMMALKLGLQRTGEGAEAVRNVMCDIKEDNSIHVTDANTRRVFVLREVQGDTSPQTPPPSKPAAAPQTPPPAKQPVEPPKQAQPKQAPAVQPASASAPTEKLQAPAPIPKSEPAPKEQPRMRVGSSTHEALKREQQEAPAKVLSEKRQRTTQLDAISRPETIGRANEKVSDTLIEDVFLEIQDIHEGQMSMEDVVNFVMDMAVDKVNSESGSILFVDVNGQELYFATARGPKAKEIMNFRVPMGKGIVGFCAREGVSLAISDADRDPRFYKNISQALGYPTKSLLCAAVQHEGRVYGAIELINKNRVSQFSSSEMGVLTYIGRQLGQYVHDIIMQREKIS